VGNVVGSHHRIKRICFDGAGPWPSTQIRKRKLINGDKHQPRISRRIKGRTNAETEIDGLVFEKLGEVRLLRDRHRDERHQGSDQMVEARLHPTGRQGREGLRHADYLRKKERAGKLYRRHFRPVAAALRRWLTP